MVDFACHGIVNAESMENVFETILFQCENKNIRTGA